MAYHPVSCRREEVGSLAGFFENLPFPLGYASPLVMPMSDERSPADTERRAREDRRTLEVPLSLDQPERRQRPERRHPMVEYLPIEEYIEVLEVGRHKE